jgi:hypothetical protein
MQMKMQTCVMVHIPILTIREFGNSAFLVAMTTVWRKRSSIPFRRRRFRVCTIQSTCSQFLFREAVGFFGWMASTRDASVITGSRKSQEHPYIRVPSGKQLGLNDIPTRLFISKITERISIKSGIAGLHQQRVARMISMRPVLRLLYRNLELKCTNFHQKLITVQTVATGQ